MAPNSTLASKKVLDLEQSISGVREFCWPFPGVETPGYGLRSLRDQDLAGLRPEASLDVS